ncbi:MAG: hypothetical protein DSZ23_01895 [Thermodesulfatator sp.]|nr:MAG: hypothetical protein DSZ23_01895 [Thermodesulfatator sp.]
MFTNILLATDGQEHTLKATEICLDLALACKARVTAIHVIDPYLKQFYNEIYAQGRKEYLEHVDRCLETDSEKIEKELRTMFEQKVPGFLFVKSFGDPEKEIITELKKGRYDLLITGGKILSGITKIKSWNLPARLEAASPGIPVLVCRT